MYHETDDRENAWIFSLILFVGVVVAISAIHRIHSIRHSYSILVFEMTDVRTPSSYSMAVTRVIFIQFDFVVFFY